MGERARCGCRACKPTLMSCARVPRKFDSTQIGKLELLSNVFCAGQAMERATPVIGGQPLRAGPMATMPNQQWAVCSRVRLDETKGRAAAALQL